MKTLLIKSKQVLIDDPDFDDVANFSWHINSKLYVLRYIPRKESPTGKKKIEYLHQYLIGKIPSRMVIDHINGNTLDNRKSNLRVVTRSQNASNSCIWKNNKSGFKGVSWHKGKRKWQSRITFNGKTISLGHYNNSHGAWLARRLANRLYFSDHWR